MEIIQKLEILFPCVKSQWKERSQTLKGKTQLHKAPPLFRRSTGLARRNEKLGSSRYPEIAGMSPHSNPSSYPPSFFTHPDIPPYLFLEGKEGAKGDLRFL